MHSNALLPVCRRTVQLSLVKLPSKFAPKPAKVPTKFFDYFRRIISIRRVSQLGKTMRIFVYHTTIHECLLCQLMPEEVDLAV